jgi:hypothetical protein
VIGRFQVRPPTRSRASSTVTERPARTIVRAALRPAKPAPTTTTSAFRADESASDELEGSSDASARARRGTAAAAAPAAAPPISVRLVKRVSVSRPKSGNSHTKRAHVSPRPPGRPAPSVVVGRVVGRVGIEPATSRLRVARLIRRCATTFAQVGARRPRSYRGNSGHISGHKRRRAPVEPSSVGAVSASKVRPVLGCPNERGVHDALWA